LDDFLLEKIKKNGIKKDRVLKNWTFSRRDSKYTQLLQIFSQRNTSCTALAFPHESKKHCKIAPLRSKLKKYTIKKCGTERKRGHESSDLNPVCFYVIRPNTETDLHEYIIQLLDSPEEEEVEKDGGPSRLAS
jgi:hypothetical protein